MSRMSNAKRVEVVTLALGSYVKDVRNGEKSVSMAKKLSENGYSATAASRLAKYLVAAMVEEKYIRIHRDKTVSWMSERRLLEIKDVPRILKIADEAAAIQFNEMIARKAAKALKCHIAEDGTIYRVDLNPNKDPRINPETGKFWNQTEEPVKEAPAHTESSYQWGEKPLSEMAWTCSFSW